MASLFFLPRCTIIQYWNGKHMGAFGSLVTRKCDLLVSKKKVILKIWFGFYGLFNAFFNLSLCVILISMIHRCRKVFI
jgi:hypothetical protein